MSTTKTRIEQIVRTAAEEIIRTVMLGLSEGTSEKANAPAPAKAPKAPKAPKATPVVVKKKVQCKHEEQGVRCPEDSTGPRFRYLCRKHRA
jgi:hypothetical protein